MTTPSLDSPTGHSPTHSVDFTTHSPSPKFTFTPEGYLRIPNHGTFRIKLVVANKPQEINASQLDVLQRNEIQKLAEKVFTHIPQNPSAHKIEKVSVKSTNQPDKAEVQVKREGQQEQRKRKWM